MSLNDFEFGTKLGKGAFGSVSIVKRKEDQQIYAMKRVKIKNLNNKEKDNSFNEVRILASLRHKNIIGYKEAFFDEKSSTLNIVMEYADDGDLSTKIKEMLKKNLQFEENTIWSILIQILEGLNYLHKSSVIHRDLKSANIFLTKKGIVKIGDLNVSKIAKKDLAVTQTGTPYYAAPEVWDNEKYNNKCDIWSVGCILYEMATLHVPFRGTSIQQLYKNIMKGKYLEIPNIYSDDLKMIIKLILTLNPLKRPSTEDLLNNEIILNKIKEIGIINGENKEKAMLMKTIKIPKNISKINLELPKKQYSRDKNIEEMMENDEYETAKQTFYRPESADKIFNTVKKFVFDNGNIIENKDDDDEKSKKMKTLNEKQMIEELLKKNNMINLIDKNNLNKKFEENFNFDITNLDENIISNKTNDNNKDNTENKSILFNSSIPECIQGTVIFKKENNEKKKEEKLKENIIYKEKEANKFSNIDYMFDETNNNIACDKKENIKEEENNINEEKNNSNEEKNNINEEKNNINEEKNNTNEEKNNINDKLNKIKISTDNLVIDQNSNKNNNKEILEIKTIKKREKKEVINTDPINLIKSERRYSDTKKEIYAFAKKNINVKNIKNLYLKEKHENNNINNRIKTIDQNIQDNHHTLSTANDVLPKIGKAMNSILTNKKVDLKFKNNINNQIEKNNDNSFLLEQDLNRIKNNNKNIKFNQIIDIKNNINNSKISSNKKLIPIVNYLNKKEMKLELNKLNLNTNEKDNDNNKNIFFNNDQSKIRPNSVKFKNSLKLRPISSRLNNKINIGKNDYISNREKIDNILLNNKDNNVEIPIIPDIKSNNINIFSPPPKNEYKLFYNHYFQNFLNLKSTQNFDNKDKINTPSFFNKINNNSKDYEENEIKRKVIYEKIKIEKKGEEIKYNKGDQEIRYVGLGNHYNRFNIVLSKYPNLLKINNDYGIQYFSGLNKNKNHKDVPMLILPNKMLN